MDWIRTMQAFVVLCMGLGTLTLGAEALTELGKTTEQNEVTDSDPLSSLSSEADVSSLQKQLVDSTPELSGTKQTQGTRHMRAIEDIQSFLGRTNAVWVELNAVLERWFGTSRNSNAILRELKEEKRRLMDLEEQKAKKKQEEEEDDDDDEEEDDDDEEEDEEEEEEEEEEAENEDEEEAEKEEEENDATNSTLTEDGFTDSLPDGCQLEGARISCKHIGLSDLPIITNMGVTILELPGNNLTQIPPHGFDGLSNLEEVDLSMNLLEDSSFGPNLFMNLTKLRILKLDDNSLTTIPHLPSSLEELKMHNNRINQLASHSFKGLSNLQVLELTGNLLYEGSVAPWAFRPLKELKFLRLDKNRFSSIPAGLPPSLEDLRMQENQIVEVQDRLLHTCVNLKALDLSHNLLRENNIYPKAWINLPKLEALDLSHNQMSVVPSHLPRALRQLSLQHNHIHAVPPYSLSHLRPGLQSLRLSHNLLEEQRVLGKSFRGVYHTLVELFLDNNRLETVPRNIRHFKNLQLLRLDHNRISSVPVRSVCKVNSNEKSHLSAVHLEHNYIDVQRIPRTALSCIRDPSTIFLEPQTPTVLQ